MKTGIELIAQERQEQIEKHGRTIQLDVDFNSRDTMYQKMKPLVLFSVRLLDPGMAHYPDHWNEVLMEKMLSKPYKERLIIAGALIAAEIDRLQLQTP